ncbi:MAG TPA: ABC transporter ATP-binding protein [Candidatus Avidehalobacter gallistercoris]|uniref:ABC transporter ATP-binding protein n=1 Tax=Candidatus Avidehalobacter gallistercoris TaxID=2840694 RepID=A0A9D1KZ07_9FIRM|nr:ABC transporter ATP-binding protein [Candidatus Avidehalobacter gallistercoris]
MSKKLLACMRGYTLAAVATPLCIVGEVALDILIPLVMAAIINVGLAEGNVTYICKMGALMLLMAFCSLLFGVLAGRFAAVAGMGFAKNIRSTMFAHIQEFSFRCLDKFSTASLITRLTTDVTNTQMAVMMGLRMLFRAPMMLIFGAAMAFYINKRLALVLLVALPILAVAIFIIFSQAFPRFQRMMDKYDALNVRTQENLSAIRVVKAFVRGDYETKIFADSVDELQAASFRGESLIITVMPIMQLVMYGCMLAIAWFGGRQIIGGTMLVGDLMSFISYISQILMAVMMIAMISVNLILSRASIRRISEVLHEEPDLTEPDNPQKPSVKSDIQFENVSFAYGAGDAAAENVLSDINLTINAGETVGIIGGTGSGKSTLVQLIPRLYDATAGRVLVGGVDVKEQNLAELRARVGMVLQKNLLFSGTIAENLRWGNPDATQAEIETACKQAAAHDFIMSFPDGYDTVLGQGGVNLSGGQKQRLTIARALLKRPEIIILDDSTSAVDTATDSAIRRALKETLSGTTAIIVAQRITSVMDADKIVVLDDGRISAVGTHDELLAKNQIYQEVYYSQQKGGEDDAAQK